MTPSEDPHPSQRPDEAPPIAAQTAKAADWQRLHLWQIQPIRDLLVLAAVIGLVWVGYRLSVVTVPILLALLLAYLFEPLVRTLTRKRTWGRLMSRGGAALAIIGVTGVLVVVPAAVGVGFAVAQGTQAVIALASNATRLKNALDDPNNPELRAALGERTASRWIYDFVTRDVTETPKEPLPNPAPNPTPNPGPAPASSPPTSSPDSAVAPADAPANAEPAAPETKSKKADGSSEEDALTLRERIAEAVESRTELRPVVNWAINWVATHAGQIGREALGAGTTAFGAAARGFTWLGTIAFGGFLTAFFFYFFCTGYGRVQRFWESLIPERRRGRVMDLLQQMDRAIAGFVRGRLTIAAILIVYYTFAYAIIDVPAWTILGPAVGLLTLIPYASSAAVPVVILVMWLGGGGGSGWSGAWWFIIGAPIAIQLIQQILDDYILTPRIQGQATGISTPAVVFASIAGGLLAGLYGLLLAIPVAACIKIVLREFFWPRVQRWAKGQERDLLPIGDDP